MPIRIGNKDLIQDYVYSSMTKIVYPSERMPWEKEALENTEIIRGLMKTTVNMFYTFASDKDNIKDIISSLRKYHTDIILRFYVTCVDQRDHYCASHAGFAILNILKSDVYQFPAFSSK